MTIRIPGLPDNLIDVPDHLHRTDWLRWREGVLAWREYMHRVCDSDYEQRAIQYRLCADDPAYFLCMFGVLYEPRGTVDLTLDDDGNEAGFDRPPGWYPWIPFAFQVDIIRWFQGIMGTTYDPLGRGDGVLEKSRELGVSWLFCLLAAHAWLFGDNQTIMLMSSKGDLVDNRNDPKALFFKIRALTGVYGMVPKTSFAPGTPWDGLRCRLPDWLTPPIVPREHDFLMKLLHPLKPNTIVGETTTSTSGTGGRATWLGIDEGSKNPKLKDIWGGLASVSYHRFVFSSASLEYGPDFYDLARAAQEATQKGTPGPSYYRASWDLHPLRDDNWLESERARSTDPYDFMREYEINYHAGYGGLVYSFAQQMMTTNAPYEPGLGQVACAIDPGLRDPTAVLWFQKDAGHDRFRLFESLTMNLSSAETLAPILMGFPPGHPERQPFIGDPDVMEVMDTTWELRQRGESVLFVGDPYGDNAGGGDTTSFYDTLFATSKKLSDQYPELPPVVIGVRTKYDQGARFHRKRKESLTQLLPKLDIHDTPRGKHALEALREMRYRPLSTTQSSMSEPARPIHSWGSHVASAGEYFAVHATVRENIERMVIGRSNAPKRRSIAPKKRVA